MDFVGRLKVKETRRDEAVRVAQGRGVIEVVLEGIGEERVITLHT